MRGTWLVLALAAPALGLVTSTGGSGQPLPDREPFLREVRSRLQSDAAVLRRYSYRRTVVERERADDGRVVETHTRTWQVRPLPDDREGFRFLVSRDGRNEPAEAVRAHERDYERRLARARSARTSEAERARLKALAEEARRDEAATVADVVGLYDIALVGRDTVDGRSCVRITFTPRPGFEPSTRNGRVLRSVRGRACVAVDSYEMIEIEAVAAEPIRFGWGILARVAPGARATIERRPAAEGAWVPVRYDFTAHARVLLLKSVEKDATVTFSEFRSAPPDAVMP